MRAPGGPGAEIRWGPGRKQAFGTAPGSRSRVWFTIAQGNLSEVFHPAVDRPALLGLRFLVAAPGAPPIDDAAEAEHEVRWVEPGIPCFRVESRHAEYTLVKEFVTHPEADLLLCSVRFRPEMPDVRLYVQASPHERADGWVVDSDPPALAARQGDVCMALVGPFSRCSAGYLNTSDLFVDLYDNDGLLTQEYARADGGSIALGAEVGLRSGSFQLALAFGRDPESAEEDARAALSTGAGRVREAFERAWRAQPDVDRNLFRVAGDGGALARSSLTVLRSLEDKARPGAFVAAPTAPWGLPGQSYARVWNRDLFHIATALLDAGDGAPARRALGYLEQTQLADGSWPQNQTVSGEAGWEGRELDEVAFPILLVWRLGVAEQLDHDPWPQLVRRAAAYLVRTGPSTPLDRWEDAGGLSPSTLAAAIPALVIAAAMAEESGAGATADHLLAVADHWNEGVEAWTYLRAFRHYVRISADSDRGARREDAVGLEFLELVRRGLRRADDPRILNSLTTADVLLKVPLPGGSGWRRYVGDAYGEAEDGSPWAGEPAGRGRPWPLLAGERAHHELAAGRSVAEYVRAIESWAGAELMLPEQVWDAPSIAERGLSCGLGTGSAAPLGWAHAEYLRLLAALARSRLPDVVDPARRRYATNPPAAPPPVWSPAHPFRTFPAGRPVRVQLPGRATVHWSGDRQGGTHSERTYDTGLGCWVAELPLQAAPVGSEVRWLARYGDGSEEGPHPLTAAAAPD